MANVVEAFEKRAAEVNTYLNMLRAMDEPGAAIAGTPKKSAPISAEWLRISKASFFLVLYNLVEATIRDSIGVMYDKVQRESINVGSLHEDFLKVWIDQEFRRINSASATPTHYRDTAVTIIECILQNELVRFDSKYLPLSGNLDDKQVRTICQKHGVSVRVSPLARGGEDLRTVKRRRNSLAHGEITFSECGQEYSLSQLEHLSKSVIAFMRGIVKNIQDHIKGRLYCRTLS